MWCRLLPYGYSLVDRVENYNDTMAKANVATEAIKSSTGLSLFKNLVFY